MRPRSHSAGRPASAATFFCFVSCFVVGCPCVGFKGIHRCGAMLCTCVCRPDAPGSRLAAAFLFAPAKAAQTPSAKDKGGIPGTKSPRRAGPAVFARPHPVPPIRGRNAPSRTVSPQVVGRAFNIDSTTTTIIRDRCN